MADPNDDRASERARDKERLDKLIKHLQVLRAPAHKRSFEELTEDFEQAKRLQNNKKMLEVVQRIKELVDAQQAPAAAPATAPEPTYTSKDYEKAVVQHDFDLMFKIAQQLASKTTPAERQLQPPEGVDVDASDAASEALNMYYAKAQQKTYHPAPNLQNLPLQEEPVPQVDNGEALNISGAISAISVNNFQRNNLLPPDVNGNPIVRVTQGYRLTVTIDTFDVETVKKLIMIRTKQNHGKVTADLIVWPLQ